jgi:tRNA(fMet)-specific endonuclease VapC
LLDTDVLSALMRRDPRTVFDADILVAATALEHGLPVATANTAHFSRIEGLSLQNWIGPA